jgi:DNA-binding CsgD family transcriptional regulator
MNSSADGFILLGPDLEIVYVNSEAMQILGYPKDYSRPSNPELQKAIRALFEKRARSSEPPVVGSVESGRRTYCYRAFQLHSNGNGHSVATALLIERGTKSTFDGSKVASKFKLTQREGEALKYLAQGLSSKEIAARMSISPNTVKAFMRLIMVKMGTTTRYGILGKIFESTSQ